MRNDSFDVRVRTLGIACAKSYSSNGTYGIRLLFILYEVYNCWARVRPRITAQYLCIVELELMIAPKEARRKGYGRATILTFLHYIQIHVNEILAEYKSKLDVEKMRLLQLKVKIGSKNEKSILLFESIGFIKVDESPNYFGELELTFEGFLSEERTAGLMKKYEVQEYRGMKYQDSTS